MGNEEVIHRDSNTQRYTENSIPGRGDNAEELGDFLVCSKDSKEASVAEAE